MTQTEAINSSNENQRTRLGRRLRIGLSRGAIGAHNLSRRKSLGRFRQGLSHEVFARSCYNAYCKHGFEQHDPTGQPLLHG